MISKVKKMIFVMLLGVTVINLPLKVKAATYRYTNQQVTAYVSEAGNKTADGSNPSAGTVAVHPKAYSVPNNALDPVLPFGTVLVTDVNITIPYQNKVTDHFYVEDTGE